MEKSQFPNVSKDLLDELLKRFPDVMPMDSSIHDIYVLQGQVLVVRFLKHQFDLQNQNILES